MPVIVVGTQRQFPRPCLPINGVSEAQQHAVRTRLIGKPAALHAGVQEEVLLLVRIAQHPLMNQIGAITGGIVLQRGCRCCFVYEEIVNLWHNVAAGNLGLYKMTPCLIAHTGEIRVVVAVM